MSGASSLWIPLSIAIPLAAALLSIVAGRWVGKVAALATIATAAAAFGCLLTVVTDGPVQYAVAGWQPPLGIAWVADSLSVFLLATTAVVTTVASIYAGAYVGGHGPSPYRFWPLWFFLWAALNALYLSGDAFNLYVTLELMSLAAAGLTALGGTRQAVLGALRYLLASLAGSLTYLTAVTLLYGSFGTLDLAGISAASASARGAAPVALALITVAMLLKTALLPLHFWLPGAHANAPSPVSAMLSGLVIKASLYILLRFWFDVLPGAQGFADLLGVFGAVAIIWGAWQAYRQKRLKLVVAYSTVSQIGYPFLLFPLARSPAAAEIAWSAALYFIAAHAMAKAAIFLSAGAIQRSLGKDDLLALRGKSEVLAPSFLTFGIAAVTLMGLPPSGGFIAKWLLLEAAFVSGQWWWSIPILGGSLLAAAYLFRVIRIAFAGPQPEFLAERLPWALKWSPMLLALGAMALGFVAAWPLEFLARAESAP